MTLNILRTIVLPIGAVLLGSTAPVLAQGETKEGFSLAFDHALTVVPDTLVNGTFKLPAYTIAVYETDANGVMEQWKAEMKANAQEVTGSRPVKAIGARIMEVAETPFLVLATSTSEKKAGLARLTLAFALNDSTTMPADGTIQGYMRNLAVKFNKAVVQTQIATYEKSLGKASEKLSDAKDKEASTRKKLIKANTGLEKTKTKRAKVMADNAQVMGEIHGLEKKFALTNDPKDLQKLTKARTKLAKGESAVAKLMQSEAKAQGNVNKLEATLPGQANKQQDVTQTKEEVERIITALKRKQDNIR